MESPEDQQPAHGHRTLPHTADVILEAWGADVPTCFEEAVAALLGTCIDASRATIEGRSELEIGPSEVESMLLALLDELLFVLDTAELPPVAARIDATPSGGLRVSIDHADRRSVEASGSVPKAVSRSEVRVEAGDRGVRCTFLVDV